ncbi:hypothetical protein C8J57DRAFT_1711980 [Mycena rebaudengoi]|nr:hypothetical protein C8J57DRAFT_1711980 [Mycena rebaudengoi]
MHPCLKVPELVGLVCSHLLDPRQPDMAFEVNRPKHGDLTVLARTSTVFSSHALRLLWKSVTLISLLRCLPSDSFELRTTGEGYFTKYMMASDLERVLVYAPHVKHLFSDPHYADLSSILPSVSPWLHQNMLPNLQGLYWMHQKNDFQYIDYFLAPQLTTIRIPHTSLAALSLLSSLALRCPQLTNITLFPRGESHFRSLAVSAVSACVRGLHTIETLIADMVDQPALEHLSRLSSVRHIRLGELPPTLPATPSHTDALFSSLQTLCFSSEIESLTLFLEWGNKLPLVEFTAECPAFSTCRRSPPHSAASSVLSISPPFLFYRVWGLTWMIPTVTDMACSWRHIEHLEFQSYYGNAAPRTTLQCLEAFARYCPRLTKLSITFNATVIPISQTDFPMPLECLKNLDVEASPISTALPVARFLARIFPSLNSISTLRDSLDGDDDLEAQVGPEALQYDRQWMEVASILHSSATHHD